jgi:hypothetical protein
MSKRKMILQIIALTTIGKNIKVQRCSVQSQIT